MGSYSIRQPEAVRKSSVISELAPGLACDTYYNGLKTKEVYC